MNKKLPLITIGMTCFNAQDTITRAIKSALDQDYPNFEIIIIDDCSSDNSNQVIQKAIQGYDNITFIRHDKNTGVAGAHNSIIKNANGDFIATFDDDDISLPHRLSTQYKHIKKYESLNGAPLLGCWSSGYKQYDNGYQAPFEAIGSKPNIPVGADLIQSQLYMGRNPDVFFGAGTPSCSLMVRKNLYNEVGLYNEDMRRTEDTDFALRLAKKGGHFIGCPEQLVIQSASTGHDKRPEIAYKSELNLIQKHKDLFEPPRRYHYASDWIKLRYHHFNQERILSIISLGKLFIKYPYWTWEQFWRSAPKRLRHEKRMKNDSKN